MTEISSMVATAIFSYGFAFILTHTIRGVYSLFIRYAI